MDFIGNDKVKAIIVIAILFLLALYNFYSIPSDVLQQMKDKLNEKNHKIYSYQNNTIDSYPNNGNSGINNNSNNNNQQIGGNSSGFPTQGLYYMKEGPNYKMSQWDNVQNTWDPIRLHDLYNAQRNPIVYQGFGIPLMSDLMCSSYVGLDKGSEAKANSRDRAEIPPLSTNTLGTIPSDEKSMFYFADNISAPECCPGPYSSDAGCVCSFEKASFPLFSNKLKDTNSGLP